MIQHRTLLFGLAAIVSAAVCMDAPAAPRVALVVGNGDYKHTTPLINPRNDAVDMARALKGLGFEVIEGFDLDEDALASKLREFQGAARYAEVTLFFYAGHALQVDGKNYLVPTDARLVDEVGLGREAFELAAFLGVMRGGTNLVFLDACRDNPLARSLARSMGATRSAAVGRGLGRVEPTAGGTLIAYATQPGNVAIDGEGRNSPFTEALLANIATPGRSVNDVLAAVTGAVLKSTKGQQEPWVHTSLREPFYFKLEVVADVESDSEEAARLYEAAERVNTVEAYALVPKRFPDSPYADLARLQIAKLEADGTSSPGAATATDAATAGTAVPPASLPQAPGVPVETPPAPEAASDDRVDMLAHLEPSEPIVPATPKELSSLVHRIPDPGSLPIPAGDHYGYPSDGSFTGHDASRYVGAFHDHNPHGFGTYTWADGDRYKGHFRRGKMHGRGTYTFADGRVWNCEWRKNVIIAGSCEHDLSVARTWKAKDRAWNIELKMSGDYFDASLYNSAAARLLKCRGEVGDAGEIDAWCRGGSWAKRKLVGTFPNLKLSNPGAYGAGGASFAFELDKESRRNN